MYNIPNLVCGTMHAAEFTTAKPKYNCCRISAPGCLVPPIDPPARTSSLPWHAHGRGALFYVHGGACASQVMHSRLDASYLQSLVTITHRILEYGLIFAFTFRTSSTHNQEDAHAHADAHNARINGADKNFHIIYYNGGPSSQCSQSSMLHS